MRTFRLFYLGKIPSNGNPKQKHRIRRVLHPQLQNFWKSSSIPIQAYPAERQVGNFFFVPIIPEKAPLNPTRFKVRLDILMLKPQPTGVISQGGDIDNQMKTLLDSLCIPNADQLPPGVAPPPGGGYEDPFFCLLEDDSQIDALNISVDRLLIATHPKRMALVIEVTEIASPYVDMQS